MVERLFLGNHKLAVQVVFVVTACFGPRVVSYFGSFCIHREVLQANGCSVACKFFVTYLVPLPGSVRMNSFQIYCGKGRFCSGCQNL